MTNCSSRIRPARGRTAAADNRDQSHRGDGQRNQLVAVFTVADEEQLDRHADRPKRDEGQQQAVGFHESGAARRVHPEVSP